MNWPFAKVFSSLKLVEIKKTEKASVIKVEKSFLSDHANSRVTVTGEEEVFHLAAKCPNHGEIDRHADRQRVKKRETERERKRESEEWEARVWLIVIKKDSIRWNRGVILMSK